MEDKTCGVEGSVVVVLDFQPVLRAVGGPVFRLSSEMGGRYLGNLPKQELQVSLGVVVAK